jgi:pimeloyl-ACP methyl ester carboxylesterase
MNRYHTIFGAFFVAWLFLTGFTVVGTNDPAAVFKSDNYQTRYRTITVQNLYNFYRDAGSGSSPAIIFLHGFPTSSHMFRNLIPALADDFRLVVPDYPGFGNSAMPDIKAFDYTFDRLADVIEDFLEKLDLKCYSLYVMDYGAPSVSDWLFDIRSV